MAKVELPLDFDIHEYIRTKRRIPREIVEAIFGTYEQFHRDMVEFQCRLDLIHSDAVAVRYPGEYVAVYGKEVVDHDPDCFALRRRTDALEFDQERLTVGLARRKVEADAGR